MNTNQIIIIAVISVGAMMFSAALYLLKRAKRRMPENFDLMEGHEFEYYCAELLRKNGYRNVEVTKASGDQGIDIIAYKNGVKYGIQCKCYSSNIGNKAVQEVFAGIKFYDCKVGIVMTNRYYTASAKELAAKNGIILYDRDKLNDLIYKSKKK